MTAAAVNPERVLKDLHELWEQLAREQKEAGVLRACAMTLIVIAEDDADCEHVRQMLGVLMHDHPSRAIVLKAMDGAETGARVFAECWMPFGKNQQICSEGIQMSADAANLGEIAQILVPLIVPDLPVALWCRGPRFFSTRYFDPLFKLADKIVVDSETAPNAKGAIAVLKELHTRGEHIADLAWTRITGWRQSIANAFEDAPAKVSDIRIAYAGHMTTGILYFSQWLERCVPSVRIDFEELGDGNGIKKVTFSGHDISIDLTTADGSLLEVVSAGRASHTLLPATDPDSLLRAELSITGYDPIFESLLK